MPSSASLCSVLAPTPNSPPVGWLPSPVRGRGDHPALGRIAVAADDQRPPAQLRMPQHLDGRDELVEVHVQYPVGHVQSVHAAIARKATDFSNRGGRCGAPERRVYAASTTAS